MAARWSVALLGGALRARGADGAQTLQGPIFGLEIPIDARGEPGGGGAARRQHPRRHICGKFRIYIIGGCMRRGAESRLRGRGRWTGPKEVVRTRAGASANYSARGTGEKCQPATGVPTQLINNMNQTTWECHTSPIPLISDKRHKITSSSELCSLQFCVLAMLTRGARARQLAAKSPAQARRRRRSSASEHVGDGRAEIVTTPARYGKLVLDSK